MLARLLIKFFLLVVATFLFVVLYDNGPTDYASALERNFRTLVAKLQSGS
jgi:hypothetical protein